MFWKRQIVVVISKRIVRISRFRKCTVVMSDVRMSDCCPIECRNCCVMEDIVFRKKNSFVITFSLRFLCLIKLNSVIFVENCCAEHWILNFSFLIFFAFVVCIVILLEKVQLESEKGIFSKNLSYSKRRISWKFLLDWQVNTANGAQQIKF